MDDLTELLSPARATSKARIELGPMINLMIFLFLVCALFNLTIERIQSLEARLPSCDPVYISGLYGEPPLLIQVSAGRDIYVNRELADIASLPRLIEEYKARLCGGQEPSVIVTGDDLAKHGALVRAVDMARGARIDRIAVETFYRPTGR